MTKKTKTKPKFVLVFSDGDQHISASLIKEGNEFQLGYTNYDEHGWGGLELFENIIKNIADALDIDIIREDEE